MSEQDSGTKDQHQSGGKMEIEGSGVGQLPLKVEDPKKFGTLNGVFRPTILTILGVMMYLREGWVVGNAGLLGAFGVILACYVITGTTAGSISSISTNMRVGSGGVFSIISQSLGLEVGGSVGIPLFLAQGLSAALYMQGIVETWLYVFPTHQELIVTACVFGVSFALCFAGARFAFRVQTVVVIGLILALVSMGMGLRHADFSRQPELFGSFEDGSFWVLFAVFFPAATGIMVGSSLSGSLKKPRRSIPIGTLSAWGLSLLVYLLVAVWYAYIAPPEVLRDPRKLIAVEYAWIGELVLLGIVSSCFSATLSSLVAAPRVLQALANYRIVPFSRFFAGSQDEEPRNAVLFTGGLVFSALLLGDLNAIAKVLTMFFLVIYFMINLVLFIEQRLKMLSFRPMFRIPGLVPIIGAATSFTAIIIINPVMGLFAVAFVVGLYLYLDHKHLQTPWETVHSGLFNSIAYWAAKKVILTAKPSFKRSWKPELLIPTERSTQLEGYYRIVRALTYPQGSVQIAAFVGRNDEQEKKAISDLIQDMQLEHLFATCGFVESRDFMGGLRTCLSVKSGSFFRPNTIFTSLENRTENELNEMIEMAQDNSMGVIFLGIHPESRLGRERVVNLWVRDQSPDWQLGLQLANLDYSVLTAYQLKVNWNAKIRVLSVIREPENVEEARTFLKTLLEYARMPSDVEIIVETGNFKEYLKTAPRADLSIMGLSENVKKEMLEGLVTDSGGSCIFVLDSGNESALA